MSWGEFDEALRSRPRWLVLNKIDLLSEQEVEQRMKNIVEQTGWRGECFTISAITGEGSKRLTGMAMTWLENNPADAQESESEDVLLT